MVVIETERLILRPMGPGDLEDFLELHREPAVAEFLGPATHEHATERLARCRLNWEERGHDLMSVIERSSGRFVGRVGLQYWPQFNETEAGWGLRKRAWGHGYATEAARAVIEWGFSTFPLTYVTAMIRPDNGRSMEVARRLGMTPLRDDVLLEFPVIVHAIDRERWGRPGHPDQVEEILVHVAQWARVQPDIVAVALVGSRARGTPRADSDVDLVFLSRDPARFVDDEGWAAEFGGAAVVASAHRGMLVEQRLRTPYGLELDVAIGPPRWATSAPGGIGVRAVHDPQGVLKHLTTRHA